MEESNQKPKREDYCILFRENKGYYLSKVAIAESMKLDMVAKGEKKYCLNRIERLNLNLRAGL